MRDEEWDRMVSPLAEDSIAVALGRVRTRAAARRAAIARRWRVVGLAAALVVTFGAGLLVGRMSGGRHDLTRVWALGGGSVEANRASFVAVPRGATP
jgi:hypothetical protein